MIERKFVAEKLKELQIQKFMAKQIGKGKYSYFEIKKTPLGEKVIIYTSRPGLVVGKKGENINLLTHALKNRFNLENPQIEVTEVANADMDAQTLAENIVSIMERFGPKRFKSLGYKTLQRIMDAGAMGAEIIIGGRGVPSSRARSWRFYAGYLKKSGDIAESEVLKGQCVANLKSGSVGVKVQVMLPNTPLPDYIKIKDPESKEIKVEEVVEKEETPEEEPKKKTAKKKVKKKAVKKKKEKSKEDGDAKDKA
ncbi:MAG: 30S ribosomal protein S3 [Candidatus Woesearchaeota archaeon]